MPSIPQVIVSETIENGTYVDGYVLGKYDGYLGLDQKFDFTSNTGHIRGRWITIFDEHKKETSPSPDHSLMLAEVRVYGGNCM